MQPATSAKEPGYPRQCGICESTTEYYAQSDFGRHLRLAHATKEGGSFICRYGKNNVCQKLPIEGVSDHDYETHIRKFHTGVDVPEKSRADGDVHRNVSIYSASQNLCSVLADPRRSRTDTSTFFTRHWGDTFTPSAVVPPSPFLPSFQSNSAKAHLEKTIKLSKKLAQNQSKGGSRRNAVDDTRTDVGDIPALFVSDSFDLSKTHTFTAVFCHPTSEDPLVSTLFPTTKRVVTKNPFETPSTNPFDSEEWRDNEELKSRLEILHDTVDSRLAAKLHVKTDAFFRIVNSYGALQAEISEAMVHINEIRNNLRVASSCICTQTSRLIRAHELREKKQRLLSKLHDISCLRAASSTVQSLLSQYDYPRALECIEISQEALSQHFSTITAFRHMNAQLAEHQTTVNNLMKERFDEIIQREFGLRANEPGQIVLEGDIVSLLIGLFKLRTFNVFYKLKLLIPEVTKTILRKTVKDVIVEKGGDLSLLDNMGDVVRSISFADWLLLLTRVEEELFAFGQRVESLQAILYDVLERVWPSGFPDDLSASGQGDQSGSSEPSPELAGSSDAEIGGVIPRATASSAALLSTENIRTFAQVKKCIDVLCEYTEGVCHARISRLVIARAAADEQRRELQSLEEFSQMVGKLSSFTAKGRDRGWIRGGDRILEACVDRVTKEYVERFHKHRKDKIGEVLDSENWKAASVPIVLQQMMDAFVSSGVIEGTRDMSGDDSAPFLTIDGEKYVVVGSALLTLSALIEHVSCARALPACASQVLLRTIELLKAFNSRTCQLILGAGALQLIGLKTISVRNLALASRSLQLVAHFIARLSTEFESLLTDDQKGQLRYFNQVRADYNDHVNEIVAKLISVIDHHTTNAIVTWEVKGAPPSPAIQQICKQLGKFHSGLYGIMPDEQIRGLFLSVNMNFKEQFKAQFAKLGISPHDVLTYGIVGEEYAFYVKSIHSMAGCEELPIDTLQDLLFA